MKSLYSTKTFWFNLLSAVLLFVSTPEFLNFIPAAALPYLMLAQGFINILLRWVTTQPVTASLTGTGSGG